jgi:hypothetical protein
MTGLAAFSARDISNILCCLAAMAFAMGRCPVGFIVLTSHGNRNDMFNIPSFPDLYLSAADVADASVRLEQFQPPLGRDGFSH